MRILIIEDEKPAADRLKRMLEEKAPDFVISDRLDSVEDSVAWLKRFPSPDLIFMDIQLADGLSFQIFEQAPVESPVIFTTAYDQYALQAFRVNSVDYLLKPIDPEELSSAIARFRSRRQVPGVTPDYSGLSELLNQREPARYKQRFLLRHGSKLSYLDVNEVAYFFSESSTSFLTDRQGKRFILDTPLDELEQQLDPYQFFRISRKMIIQVTSVRQIEPYLNGRLLLEVDPAFEEEVFVSRQRATEFKTWLDR